MTRDLISKSTNNFFKKKKELYIEKTQKNATLFIKTALPENEQVLSYFELKPLWLSMCERMFKEQFTREAIYHEIIYR